MEVKRVDGRLLVQHNERGQWLALELWQRKWRLVDRGISTEDLAAS
jgi:hypothetical protein